MGFHFHNFEFGNDFFGLPDELYVMQLDGLGWLIFLPITFVGKQLQWC